MRSIASGLFVALTLSCSFYLYASPRRTDPSRSARGGKHRSTSGTRGGTLGLLRGALTEASEMGVGRRTRHRYAPLVGHTLQGVPIQRELLRLDEAGSGELLKILDKASHLAPGLLPARRHSGQGIAFLPEGWNLAVSGADLYIAPYAMSKFRRQIFLLNSAGIGHGNISPENIWVNENGEFVLTGWHAVTTEASAEVDTRGLDRLQKFLRQEIGTGG